MAQAEQQTTQSSSLPVHRVLIAVDDSENGAAAFDYYIEHVHRPENQIIALHVSDQVKIPTYSLFSEGMGYSHEEVEAMVDKLRQKNKALEDKYNKKCNDLQIKHKVLIVSEDSHGPGHAICEYAKKHEANLIVMGSRGHGLLRRTVLGSVSTYVIHHSHIPTIVCPHHSHHK